MSIIVHCTGTLHFTVRCTLPCTVKYIAQFPANILDLLTDLIVLSKDRVAERAEWLKKPVSGGGIPPTLTPHKFARFTPLSFWLC